MKVADCIKLARCFRRYADARLRKLSPNGLYVRQALIVRATRADHTRAEKEAGKDHHRSERLIWVKIDRLKAAQSCLGLPRLIYQLRRHPIKKLPVIVRLPRGWYFVWDGHHRATAAIMRGAKRLRCRELRRTR